MKTGIKQRLIVYGTFAAAVLLVTALWTHHLRVQRAYANAALLSTLSEIELAGRTLRLIDEGRLETASRILEMRIDSSLGFSEYAFDSGARLQPLAWESLRDGLRGASERQRARGHSLLADRLDELVRRLEASPRPRHQSPVWFL